MSSEKVVKLVSSNPPDLILRTEEWLSQLLDEAARPPAEDREVWTVRDKLSLAGQITNFLNFRLGKYKPPSERSAFAELAEELRK